MGETLQLDWAGLPELLPLCVEFADKVHKKEEIDLHEFADRAGAEFGIENVDELGIDRLFQAMADGLGIAFEDEHAEAIAAIFAQNAQPVMTALVQFAQKGINDKQLVQTLKNLCLGSAEEMEVVLQQALGIPDVFAEKIAGKLGPYTVSAYCFAAAFKIYKAAADDARVARERRLEVERLANEAIARLKAERAELDKLLSDWMLDRLVPFSEGAQAMGQAILEDNNDAYIAANAELWKLLGREAAYTNESVN